MVIFVVVFAANKIIARMTILFGCHTAVYKKNRPARRSVFFCGSCKIRARHVHPKFRSRSFVSEVESIQLFAVCQYDLRVLAHSQATLSSAPSFLSAANLGTVKQLLGALARQTWYHRVLI